MKRPLGLAKGTVKLVPYDPNWNEVFRVEQVRIAKKLGVEPTDVHHVGSTSIPGILAKPIIDIAIPVESMNIADKWAKPLVEMGYWDKGPEPDMPNRRFFAKGPEECRSVYLHVVTSKEFDNLIKFRDVLLANPKIAEQYSDLKQSLALANGNDRPKYTAAKHDFIQSVLA